MCEIGDWESKWSFNKKDNLKVPHKNAKDTRAPVFDIQNGNMEINSKQFIIKI
jgi:hypothetical protein